MSLFRKLFAKLRGKEDQTAPKTETPAKPAPAAPVKPATEEPAAPAAQPKPGKNPLPTPEQLREYADAMKAPLNSLLPDNPMALQSQQEMLRAIGQITMFGEIAAENAASQVQRQGITDETRIMGVHAGHLSQALALANADVIAGDAEVVEDDVLLRAAAALDAYAGVMVAEHAGPVRQARDILLSEMYRRGIKAQVHEGPLVNLYIQALQSTEKGHGAAGVALAKALVQAEKLWLVAFIKMGPMTPCVDMGGRIFLCLNEQAGMNILEQMGRAGMPVAQLTTIRREILPDLLQNLRDQGHVHLKVTADGNQSVELPMELVVPEVRGGAISASNAPLRMMLMRQLQYQEMLRGVVDREDRRQLANALMSLAETMRLNAWRHLGRTALWVVVNADAGEDVTLITPAAMKAVNTADPVKLVEYHAPSLEMYNGALRLQTLVPANNPGAPGMVMAFTSREGALSALHALAGKGVKGSILGASWDEIAGQAEEVGGVVIDVHAFAYQIGKERFPEVIRCRDSDAGFIADLHVKEEPAGDPGAE